MTPVEIAIGVSHRPWAQDLFRHVADHGGAVVRKRVLTEEDALEEDYTVLVLDDVANVLTPRLVHELHQRGRYVVAVHAAGDPHAPEVLRGLGVDAWVDEALPPDEILAVINRFAPPPGPVVDDAFRTIARQLGEDLPPAVPARPAEPDRHRGWVTAVASPSGGCGATEVSLALAITLRLRGEYAVVVDADDVAPSLAQRLNVPLVPNVRNAVDAIEQRVGQLTETLRYVEPLGFEVLCGLSTARDWADLRPEDLANVILELALLRHQVVVNVGPHPEELISINGQPRYGATRAVLELADQVVLVAAPTPVGLARLLDWLATAQELVAGKPVHVAFNRAPASRFKRGELEQELYRSFLPASCHLLPFDRRVEEAAWNGRLLPGGPFIRAVNGIAAHLPVAFPLHWLRGQGKAKVKARGGRP